jgi:hypothetical protein
VRFSAGILRRQQGLRRSSTQYARNHASEQHDGRKRSDADQHDRDDGYYPHQILDDGGRRGRRKRKHQRIDLRRRRKRKRKLERSGRRKLAGHRRVELGGRGKLERRLERNRRLGTAVW